MSEVYDFRTISFVAHPGTVAITVTVPDIMVGIIAYARYTIGAQDGTVVVKLMQERAGTITGTLDIVTLTPNKPTIPEGAGKIDEIVAIVDPGHRVVAATESGTAAGKIIFGYRYGRMRRP